MYKSKLNIMKRQNVTVKMKIRRQKRRKIMEYKQTSEQNRAIHYILNVFGQVVRRNNILKLERETNIYIHKNENKYIEKIEYNCRNENVKKVFNKIIEKDKKERDYHTCEENRAIHQFLDVFWLFIRRNCIP